MAAPAGCRAVLTRHCHAVPEPFLRRVEVETCKQVPGVECHLVLEKEEKPKCYKVPVEECQDSVKETPYLVQKEECEDVERKECQTVRQGNHNNFLDVHRLRPAIKWCREWRAGRGSDCVGQSDRMLTRRVCPATRHTLTNQ